MNRFVFFAASAALWLCVGCVSYEYNGGTAGSATDPEDIKVYTDTARIRAPYRVLGTAKVSGDYDRVSREKLIDKLKSEAGSCGADAILIVEQQVEPSDSAKIEDGHRDIDNDMGSDSWRNIHRDVDGAYGNARKTPDTTTIYRRMIRAEYLRFDQAE